MDRLPLVALLAWACDDAGTRVPPPSRVNAVTAAPVAADPAAFCDELHAPAERAGAFSPPVLVAPLPPAAAGSWTWVNVWATWCKPCVEEMPRLVQWADRLNGEGAHLDLRFVSADAKAADLEAYAGKHADVVQTARVADPASLDSWLAGLGVEGGAVLPVHLFVDPRGRLRCARMGAVNNDDYGVIKALVTGG